MSAIAFMGAVTCCCSSCSEEITTVLAVFWYVKICTHKMVHYGATWSFVGQYGASFRFVSYGEELGNKFLCQATNTQQIYVKIGNKTTKKSNEAALNVLINKE